MNRTIVLLTIAALSACSAPSPEAKAPAAASTAPATTAAPDKVQAAPPLALSQRCTNTTYGISVAYPAGWHTNDGSVIPACSAFDPEPIVVPRESELPFDIAVIFGIETVPLDQLTRSTQWERVLSTQQLTLHGRAASRVEVEATGEGLADRGLRSVRYVIALDDGRSLLAATHATDASYPQNQEILKRMVESVTVE
ncbi:MAG TPA: hypothetical protein VF618_20425 [Thermoanaerobaculia bacterium]